MKFQILIILVSMLIACKTNKKDSNSDKPDNQPKTTQLNSLQDIQNYFASQDVSKFEKIIKIRNEIKPMPLILGEKLSPSDCEALLKNLNTANKFNTVEISRENGGMTSGFSCEKKVYLFDNQIQYIQGLQGQYVVSWEDYNFGQTTSRHNFIVNSKDQIFAKQTYSFKRGASNTDNPNYLTEVPPNILDEGSVTFLNSDGLTTVSSEQINDSKQNINGTRNAVIFKSINGANEFTNILHIDKIDANKRREYLAYESSLDSLNSFKIHFLPSYGEFGWLFQYGDKFYDSPKHRVTYNEEKINGKTGCQHSAEWIPEQKPLEFNNGTKCW